MYLKLVVEGHVPDEDAALGALDAVRVICALGQVEPAVAWRDHCSLTEWYRSGGADLGSFASEAEHHGATVWESALTATKRALQLPRNSNLRIEVLGLSCAAEPFGPDRYIWRAAAGSAPVDIARRLLTKRLGAAF